MSGRGEIMCKYALIWGKGSLIKSLIKSVKSKNVLLVRRYLGCCHDDFPCPCLTKRSMGLNAIEQPADSNFESCLSLNSQVSYSHYDGHVPSDGQLRLLFKRSSWGRKIVETRNGL